ncbi:hypothetical protein ACNKHO_02615 [Shigella flexneri]
MSQALTNLLTLLKLEKNEKACSADRAKIGLRQVFGGQVVGQAPYAAKRLSLPIV